jgi:hypothetical protein
MVTADLLRMRHQLDVQHAGRARRRKLGLWLLPIIVLIWLGLSVRSVMNLRGSNGWIVLIGMGGVQLAIFGWGYWMMLRALPVRSVRELVGAYLACGRCPSCGYKIEHVAAEGDGCVVCPECGAAWRIEGRGADD